VGAGDLDGAAVDFRALLRDTPPCADEAPSTPACRTLAVRLLRMGDVYAAVDRPNLHDPAKAAPLYEQAVRIRERQAALDDHDRQVRFDLAASYGKLGDAVWESDPKRALALYDRAFRTAKTLASKEQLEILRDSYLQAISRPFIKLHRFGEARSALSEALERAKTDSSSQYEDHLTEAFIKTMWCRLLSAEGRPDEARQALDQVIHDVRMLQVGHPDSLDAIVQLSDAYRLLASITAGPTRRDALLKSAALWHAWPETSFTKREEQGDLDAARQ
jgi:tetratricopeptide (TPR) repeat protein